MRHPIRILTTVTAGSILGLAAVAVGVQVASASGQPTLRLQATQVTETQLGLGSDPARIGDEFIDHWSVSDGRNLRGDLLTTCQVVNSSGTTATLQCTATLTLPRGQITFQGVTQASETATADFSLAVTGGTGAYRTASGEVDIHPVSGTVDQFVVRLAG